MQVIVPLRLTVTVPDQRTADYLHTTAAHPPVLSPDTSSFATRAQAAAMALTTKARARTFYDMHMPNFGTSLWTSSVTYPTISEANVSVYFIQPDDRFVSEQSPFTDSNSNTLEAFAEASAYELEVAIQTLTDLPDSLGVRSSGLYVVSCMPGE